MESKSPPYYELSVGGIENWSDVQYRAREKRKRAKKKSERKRMAGLITDLRDLVAPDQANSHISRANLLDVTTQLLENYVFGDPERLQVYLQDHLPPHVFEGTGLILDMQAVVLYALPTCMSVLGVIDENLRGQSMLQLVHEADRLKFINEICQVRGEKRQFDCLLAKFENTQVAMQSQPPSADLLPPPTCYARHRLTIRSLVVNGAVAYLLFVNPLEPTPAQPSLMSRWSDVTLSGRIPPYEVFSLQKVDSSYVISLAANNTGNRFGYGSLEANPRAPGVLEMMHPDDIPHTSATSLQAYANQQIMLVAPRFLTGHKTWIRTKSYGVYCTHKSTGQVTHIFSKSVVEDERGTRWEPTANSSDHKLMGPGSLSYETEEELFRLVHQLTIHSRNRFESERLKIDRAEEEEAVRELAQWQSAVSVNQPRSDQPQPSIPCADWADLGDPTTIGAQSDNAGAIGRLQTLPGHVMFDWDFVVRLLNNPAMLLDPSVTLLPSVNHSTRQ